MEIDFLLTTTSFNWYEYRVLKCFYWNLLLDNVIIILLES